MDWELLPPFLVTTVVGILGWFVVNTLAARRERAVKRRDRRVEFLLETYRRLERASMSANPQAHRPDLESAVADIQLLGTAEQARAADSVARAVAEHGSASIDELLGLLREDLRSELGLRPLPGRPVFLRFRERAPSGDGAASKDAGDGA